MARRPTDAYRAFDTSIVSDALDEHDIDGVITGIRPVDPTFRATGRALPMRFEAVNTETDTNFPFAMLEELEAGYVPVIDGVGTDCSCWGGRASQLAANAGVNGVVVDGGYRDVDDIRNGSFPVFGRAPTPRTGQRRVRVAATGEPVTIDGVTVAPDDLVIADATGIVVVPSDTASAVADTADDLLAEELLLERKIDRGATVDDLRQEGRSF